MTLDGLTALSVEMNTKRSTPVATAASTTFRVPKTLVADASTRVVLEHGDVLVGGGVEDDVRLVPLERLEHGRPVDDVDERELVGAPEHAGSVVEVGLVVVQQDDRLPGRRPPPAGRSPSRWTRRPR